MQRIRKTIWFNPPFNKSVTTNVGRRFLNLVDKYFRKEHKSHKIFKKNTSKVIIVAAKTSLRLLTVTTEKLNKQKKEDGLPCNYRQKNDCPMNGKSRTMNIIYNCITSVPTKPDKSCIGLSEEEWKKRYYNHRK